MSKVKRPTLKTRRISSSPSPPGSPHPSYLDPMRMDPITHTLTALSLPLCIKQVDLDGYDVVPPVPVYHNTFDLPLSTFYAFPELQDDIARAIASQNGFPHRRAEAKRDFYFTLKLHYRRATDEKRQDVRVTGANWEELRVLLVGGDMHLAGFSVSWWKKTTAQRRADRAAAGKGLACCVVQ